MANFCDSLEMHANDKYMLQIKSKQGLKTKDRLVQSRVKIISGQSFLLGQTLDRHNLI